MAFISWIWFSSILIFLRLLYSSLLGHWKKWNSGAKSAPKIPTNDFLGIAALLEHVRARREYCFPSHLDSVFERAGSHIHTASHRAINHEMFYTRDPENMKAILTAPEGQYILGNARGANLTPLLGHGVFTAEGHQWHQYRAEARPLLSQEKQVANIRAAETLLQNFLASLVFDAKGWSQQFCLQSLLLDLMLELSLEIIFDHSTVSAGEDENLPTKVDTESFKDSLDHTAAHVINRAVWGPLAQIYRPQAFVDHCQQLTNYLDNRAEFYMTRNSEIIKDLEEDKVEAIRQRLRNRAQTLLAPGRVGPSSLILVVLFHLIKFPSLYANLRQEILETFGTEGVEEKDLSYCKLLDACISEGLRIGSITPATIRKANRDTILPRGGGKDGCSPVFIPKGSSLIICIHSLHSRTDLWGTDAAAFHPDRWFSDQPGRKFMPFGKGPRRCIGRKVTGAENVCWT